ncbi:gamma carbonic anhydrase family protein [Chloroflexota bacterium]
MVPRKMDKPRLDAELLIKHAQDYFLKLDSKIEEMKRIGEAKKIAPSVFVAEGAKIFGEVTIGENSSIWFNAVLRGDEGPIVIGDNCNVQDCCVLHSDAGNPLRVGNWVTIGHSAVVRGAQIGNNVAIGMHSTVMTGAVIPEYCIIGAHSFIPYGKTFPPRSLIVGIPAIAVRELSEKEIESSQMPCLIYFKMAEYYKSKYAKGKRIE